MKEEIKSLQFEYECINFKDPNIGKTIYAIRVTSIADVIKITVHC